MIRIFLGLTILISAYISALPFGSLHSSFQFNFGLFSKWLVLVVISAIIASIFITKTKMSEQINYPIKGLTSLTIGLVLLIILIIVSLLLWAIIFVAVMGVTIGTTSPLFFVAVMEVTTGTASSLFFVAFWLIESAEGQLLLLIIALAILIAIFLGMFRILTTTFLGTDEHS